jgi:class 3 adenylate cyclase
VRVSAGGPPSGVVTFLFTDIEGSTRRWESGADAMRVALAGHDKVLRSAIEGHGGFLFKHTSDGVSAAFGSPRCAADAAVSAQRELELPVRMGIATGEAELREGEFLFQTRWASLPRHLLQLGNPARFVISKRKLRCIGGLKRTIPART